MSYLLYSYNKVSQRKEIQISAVQLYTLFFGLHDVRYRLLWIHFPLEQMQIDQIFSICKHLTTNICKCL